MSSSKRALANFLHEGSDWCNFKPIVAGTLWEILLRKLLNGVYDEITTAVYRKDVMVVSEGISEILCEIVPGDEDGDYVCRSWIAQGIASGRFVNISEGVTAFRNGECDHLHFSAPYRVYSERLAYIHHGCGGVQTVRSVVSYHADEASAVEAREQKEGEDWEYNSSQSDHWKIRYYVADRKGEKQ